MLKQIDIQNLRSGMVIVRVTEQNGPVTIKKSGLVTSQDMVQGLIEMGVQQVEVDPDQTVEVQAPLIKKSATRRMLESNKVTNFQTDDGLSLQFNRSLFLPSAQSIPPAWQFYTKRYLFAAFIALGGFGFGWILANYQAVFSLLNPQSNQSVVSASVPDVLVVAPVVVPVVEKRETNVEAVVQIVQPLVQPLAQPLVQPLVQPRNPQSVEVASIPKQRVAVPDEVKLSSEPSSEPSPEFDSLFNSEPSEVVQTVAPVSASEAKISADVLARFRKAMTEVADLPITPASIKRIPSNKVARIDQLPAWVMNSLPSMAFTAHMYASVESERWVRVNGIRMVEGDKVDDIVEIIRIEPQHVILSYSGQEFSMAALTDW